MVRRHLIVLFAAALCAVGAATACASPREEAAGGGAGAAAFESSSRPDAPAVVWAVGDGADGSPRARAVARRIAADDPDRVLYLGDVYESGSARDFRENYDAVYGRLAPITAPTPGNHDWPSHTQGYDPYWRAKTGAETPPWYAFRVGGWRVLSLNSEAPHESGSPQVRWLRSELRGERGTCTLAFWHRPLYSAGQHGDQPDTAPLWQALQGRARLVVSGHDHDSQRLRPIGGLTQLVAGAGGRIFYPVDEADPRLSFSDDLHAGALRIELRPGRARLTFVASGGRVLDRSAVRCTPGR